MSTENATATIDLSKGDKIDLTKTHPGLAKVCLGMGWDVKQGETFDLDAFCYQLKEGKLLTPSDPAKSICYFRNLNLTGVKHSGDNLTGEGDGDDETITCDLPALPADCDALIFGVNIYNKPGKSFGQVKNAHIRIYDGNGDHSASIAKYDLSEDYSSSNAVIFGRMYKHNGEWKFEAIGEGKTGDIATLAQAYM